MEITARKILIYIIMCPLVAMVISLPAAGYLTNSLTFPVGWLQIVACCCLIVVALAALLAGVCIVGGIIIGTVVVLSELWECNPRLGPLSGRRGMIYGLLCPTVATIIALPIAGYRTGTLFVGNSESAHWLCGVATVISGLGALLITAGVVGGIYHLVERLWKENPSFKLGKKVGEVIPVARIA